MTVTFASYGLGSTDRKVPCVVGQVTGKLDWDRRCTVLPLGSLAVPATSFVEPRNHLPGSWLGQGYGGLAEEPRGTLDACGGGVMNEGKKIGQMIAGLIVVVCIGYIVWIYLAVDF